MTNKSNAGIGLDIAVRLNAEGAAAAMKNLDKQADAAADAVKNIKLPTGQIKADGETVKKTLTDIAASADKAFSKPLGKLAQMAQAAKGGLGKTANAAGAAAQLLGGGVGDALRTVSDIGQMGEQLTALGKAAPFVGVGLAGLNAVMMKLDASVQLVRDRVTSYVAVIEGAAQLKAAGDRAAVEERQKQIEIDLQAKRETLARLQRENLDAINKALSQPGFASDLPLLELKRLAELGETFDGSVAKSITAATAGLYDWKAAILATDDEIKKNKDSIKLLTLAYDENKIVLDKLPEKVKSASEALKEAQDRFEGLAQKTNDALKQGVLAEQAQIGKDAERGLRNARLSRDASSEQVDAAVQDLAAQRLALEGQIADAKRALDKAQVDRQKAIQDAIDKERARTGNIPIIEMSKFSGGVDEARKYLEGLTTQLGDTKTQIDDLVNVILPEVEAREAEERAIERQKEKLEEVARLTDDLASAEGDLSRFRADRAAKLREDKARADFEAEESRLERAIEAARQSEQLQEEQTKSDAAYAEAVKEASAQYMADELKALETFRKNEQRINDDFARNNLRRLEDLNDDLTDLAAKGDVAGFMSRSEAGKKELKRSAEDASVAARRRAEDYLQERREAQNAARARLDDQRRAYEQERRDRQAQAQAQINLDRSAGTARLKQSEILENQLAELRRKWKQREVDLDVAVFKERERLLINEINAIRSQISALQKPAPSGTSTSLSVNRLPPRVSAMPTANALGGIYSEPTFTINGERPGWSDALIPFKKSEGFMPALQRVLKESGAGAGVTVDMRGAQFGALATPADLAAVEARVYTAVARALEAAS